MRHLILVPLVAVLGLGGCALSRTHHDETATATARPATPAPRAPAPDLRRLFGEETRESGWAAARPLDPAVFRHPAPPPAVPEADPVRGAFDSLPEGHRWKPESFVPSGGTLDIARLGRARLHVRAWDLDEDFRGGGLGICVPLRGRWHAAAEVGVDPWRSPQDGGVSVVAAFGLRL